MQIKEVQAVIFDKHIKEFLIIHRKGYDDSKFIWRLVKGRKNENESDLRALKREIKEETSLTDIKVSDKIFDYSYISPQKIKHEVSSYLIYTKKRYDLRCEDPNEQIKDFKWVDWNNAVKMLYFDEEKLAVKKTAEFLKLNHSPAL